LSWGQAAAGGASLTVSNYFTGLENFSAPAALTNTNNLIGGTLTGSIWGTAFLISTNGGVFGVNTETKIGNGAGQYGSQNYNISIGQQAGQQATNASLSQFFGTQAGQYATAAQQSHFDGSGAGQFATNAAYSHFDGFYSGNYAFAAHNSLFDGSASGQYATNADHSLFAGDNAGQYAGNANYSLFLGASAGQNGTNANLSEFMGYQSGANCPAASDSVFIGPNSGTNRPNTFWMDTQAPYANGAYLPLYLGYFDTRQAFINGTLAISGSVTGSSLTLPTLNNVAFLKTDAGGALEAGSTIPANSIYGWPANSSGYLENDGSGALSWGAGGGGTVASVGLSIPGFTISGSPVTGSGTLTATPNGPVLTNLESAATTFNQAVTVNSAYALTAQNGGNLLTASALSSGATATNVQATSGLTDTNYLRFFRKVGV